MVRTLAPPFTSLQESRDSHLSFLICKLGIMKKTVNVCYCYLLFSFHLFGYLFPSYLFLLKINESNSYFQIISFPCSGSYQGGEPQHFARHMVLPAPLGTLVSQFRGCQKGWWVSSAVSPFISFVKELCWHTTEDLGFAWYSGSVSFHGSHLVTWVRTATLERGRWGHPWFVSSVTWHVSLLSTTA
jgi:hypothetical protein